jgi:catechol 2,3-dioxygenase-like lactoylglutathione lyase family enzyme
MDMTLRFEVFPGDLDVIADFYQRVLGFSLVTRPAARPSPLPLAATGHGAGRGGQGLTDFRILDPAGYYLRLTDRAPA